MLSHEGQQLFSFYFVFMKVLCVGFDSKCGSCEAVRVITSAGRSGKWGESPTNQPGFGDFEPSKSNTDFMRVSRLPMETQSGIRCFDTYFGSTPLL